MTQEPLWIYAMLESIGAKLDGGMGAFSFCNLLSSSTVVILLVLDFIKCLPWLKTKSAC